MKISPILFKATPFSSFFVFSVLLILLLYILKIFELISPDLKKFLILPFDIVSHKNDPIYIIVALKASFQINSK